MRHHYVERETRQVKPEEFYGDQAVRFIYSRTQERSRWLFKQMIGGRTTRFLGYVNFDSVLSQRITNYCGFHKQLNIDLSECLDPPEKLNTPRKIFERQIRYWDCRPAPDDPRAVLSPTDSRVLLGSFREESALFIKDKFFHYEEMLGVDKRSWLASFRDGSYAIFRLTPEKYHYTHTPVAGKILDFYSIPGVYHSCHPQAVISVLNPYSKNKRVVTIIDTDVEKGTKAGLVAMIEVAALMIGDIFQCYSSNKYEKPAAVGTGMFVQKGVPKSLFRPGGSTVVLIFQRDRVRFAEDIVENLLQPNVESIFGKGLGRAMVETEVKVRSVIGEAIF